MSRSIHPQAWQRASKSLMVASEVVEDSVLTVVGGKASIPKMFHVDLQGVLTKGPKTSSLVRRPHSRLTSKRLVNLDTGFFLHDTIPG